MHHGDQPIDCLPLGLLDRYIDVKPLGLCRQPINLNRRAQTNIAKAYVLIACRRPLWVVVLNRLGDQRPHSFQDHADDCVWCSAESSLFSRCRVRNTNLFEIATATHVLHRPNCHCRSVSRGRSSRAVLMNFAPAPYQFPARGGAASAWCLFSEQKMKQHRSTRLGGAGWPSEQCSFHSAFGAFANRFFSGVAQRNIVPYSGNGYSASARLPSQCGVFPRHPAAAARIYREAA